MGKQIRSLLAAAAALSMASCANDGEEPPRREASEIPKAELIEKSDVICRKEHKKLIAALSDVPPAEAGSEQIARIAPYLERNAEAIRREVSQIVAMGTPSDDAQLLDDYLHSRTTTADALRSSADAARDADISKLEGSLEQIDDSQIRFLAARFGFKVCGSTTLRVPDSTASSR